MDNLACNGLEDSDSTLSQTVSAEIFDNARSTKKNLKAILSVVKFQTGLSRFSIYLSTNEAR